MLFQFLGTGAADRINIPTDNDFDNPDNRRCSASIIDEKLLIDCGPHVIDSLRVANISIKKIENVLITHFHSDHFNVNTINEIARISDKPVNLWYRSDAILPSGICDNCILHPMDLFETYDICGYKVTGLPANHAAFPQHFSIEKDDKKLFYGLDGAWLLGDTVRYMQGRGYNCLILDATVGDYSGDYRMGEHNSVPMIRLMVDSMKTLNIVNDATKIYLNHLAVILHKPHKEICESVKSDGLMVAYDGLKINI